MNIQFNRISGNSFRKAIASVALIAAVLVGQAACAQSITVADKETAFEKSDTKFQAFVHPIENTISMKVHFINPNQESIRVIIYNEKNHEVYKKTIGKETAFHGTFDLTNLPDGEYKVVVTNRKDAYSRSISIQSQQARFALAE